MAVRDILWVVLSVPLCCATACSIGSATGFPDGDIVLGDGGSPPRVEGGVVGDLDAGALPIGCSAEDCSNGLDDDCDGLIEEGCGCLPGEERSCFGGRAEERGLGVCRDGLMRCGDGLEFGSWEACVDDVLPAEEVCDVEENDEDCDGAVNEGCECTGSEPIPCGSEVGVCNAGVQECNDGVRGDCVGATGPSAETCNGLDDDCDGVTDESLVRVCGSDVGECETGVQTCVDGEWDACVGSADPREEICDGRDNDCDDGIDETLVRDCGSAVGACMPGTQRCVDSAWSLCSDEVVPALEDCNRIDDDCDGLTDEALTRRCGSDLGICMSGTEICSDGDWAACEGATAPGTEACDGILDEDCDGAVDEGCDCVTDATRPCGSDVGACVAGTETCTTAGDWGACTGAIAGGAESCNDVDDDCDGRTDEGLRRSCGTDTGVCRSGNESCSGGVWGACTGSIEGSDERCDGVEDEDCDGLVDEGCGCIDGATRACGDDTGECVAGTETCNLDGVWGPCAGAVGPAAADLCDGKDEDCDGMVDEGLTRVCGSDVGVCAVGVQTCSLGSWGVCEGEVGAGAELCDALLDEDCDGAVDEGCDCTDGATRDCGTDVGECVFGQQTCSAGMWGSCTGAVGPMSETCDGTDEDCDGGVDEMLLRSCGTDTGICVAGTETCSLGTWGSCEGEVTGGLEACDGRDDDDCDGRVDEGCNCTTGTTRSCGTNRGECSTGLETCDAAGQWGACEGSVGPTPELCDDLDNDCDRATDEDVVRTCGSDIGVCVSGTETCERGGVWGDCIGGVGAGLERCDGSLDEDCDTSVDEGCACIDGATRSCGIDTGACVSGTETCDLDGIWGSCSGAVGPVAETCNEIDDDCDASVDEGTCIFSPPVVMCPGDVTAEALSTISLSGSGSDPDGGMVSYSWTVTSRPIGSTAEPSTPDRSSTNFFLDASGTYELQFCVMDDEGLSTCCTVTVVSTPSGVLQVELAWEEAWGDADLHLLSAAGAPDDDWFQTQDCYFANTSPDWGPGGAVADPSLDRDDRDGFGPESITIDNMPADGVYEIGVHYFCNRSGGGSGSATATVRIYCMGELVQAYTGITLDETDDWVTVATVEWPSCRVSRVNRSTNGSSILYPAATSARHCEVSCDPANGNRDCPSGERCAAVAGGGAPRYICLLDR